MFHFVTINHPSEAKDQKRQTVLRQHAIRSGLRSKQVGSAKRNNNFVAMEVDAENGKVRRKGNAKEIAKIARPIDAALLDPFDALYGSGKRLRKFMDQKSTKLATESRSSPEDEGTVFASGLNAVFLNSLTDPTMFHALSLVLSLATSNDMPSLDALRHRGNMLKDVRRRMADAKLVPSISTLSAMLLLIGSEYRLEGTDATSVAVHIQAMQNVLAMTKSANLAVSKALRRALYWHDLHSCLFIGTPRVLAQASYAEFNGDKTLTDLPNHSIPTGLLLIAPAFPTNYSNILRELNALCHIFDSCPNPTTIHLDDVPLDDFQYCIESRLVDLLSSNQTSSTRDYIYEACIFAAFLCTYKLSTGIWEGCFIADFAALKLLGCISQAKHDPRWMQWKELLLWLLIVTGALSRKSSVRAAALVMIRATFGSTLVGMYDDWEDVQGLSKTFIWSDNAMERHMRRFWEELHE